MSGFRLTSLLLAIAFATGGIRVSAQIPPTSAETAAYTGLHAAAARNDAAEIARLLAAKADPEARDGAGRTAAHVAAFAAAPDALRALGKGGADLRALENRRYDVVTIAAVRDDAAMVRLALSLGGDARLITSPYDGTALIAAAHLGHDEVVRALIEGGAPLDHVNNLGWTALMEAVVLGDGGPRHVACARALLAAGARRDLPDRHGVTPLEHAKRRGMREMVAAFEAAAR